jgi:uncharacterized protein
MQPRPQDPDGADDRRARPWWREPMMWLVVGGPVAAMLACVATIVLALRHPDPVLDAKQRNAEAAHQLPAMKARNLAPTGGQ